MLMVLAATNFPLDIDEELRRRLKKRPPSGKQLPLSEYTTAVVQLLIYNGKYPTRRQGEISQCEDSRVGRPPSTTVDVLVIYY